MSITPSLEAALVDEIAAQAADPRHPTRVAYERARAAFPGGGEEARAAFHTFLREEKAKRDATVDRSAPKSPRVDEKTGVPKCSRTECPKYARFLDRCTEENVEGPDVCIPAVRDMVLELDSRKDAADPAFDEIIKLCGLAKTWEYPAQVVRDVEDALKKRDEQISFLSSEQVRLIKERGEKQAEVDAVVEQNQKLQAALVYARDRRGNWFDFDEWIIQVEHALDNKIPPHAIENAQAKEAQAWAAINSMRSQRDGADRDRAWLRAAWDTEIKTNEELRDKLRTAEAVRDDARRASQRYLDEKREVEERLRKAVVDWRLEVDQLDAEKRAIEAAGAEVTALVTKLMPAIQAEPPHSRECGTAYRGCAPDCAFAAAQQCPWIMPDGDPDEGYWHCKLPAHHTERHVTEFGRGLDARWYLPCEGMAHTFVGDCCRDCGYPVEGAPPKQYGPTIGGEDFIGKSAEERRAMIERVVMGDDEPIQRMTALRTPESQARLDAALDDDGPKEGECDGTCMTSYREGLWCGDPAHPNAPAPQVTKRDDGAYTAGPPPDGRSVAAHLDELAGRTKACECSPKYVELATGVHAKYCPLAGLPLDDGRKRSRCEACDLTFRAAVGDEAFDRCIQCGGPAKEVSRG